MRGVELRLNEQTKYEVIKELVDHGGNKKRVALKLGITERHVNRLILKYKERGKSGFIHGNRSKKPVSSIDKTLSDTIILLYTTKYQDFNFSHFRDYLIQEEDIKVSYHCIYTTLKKAGILSPKARKATKKKFIKQQLQKDKKLKDKTEKELEVIANHEIALQDAHPRQERPKYFGENIEMDGSIHKWFGDKITCLHLAADKATNTIVGAYFDQHETLNGYYNVFHQILTNYGIPAKFTTDNRTVFNYQSLSAEKRTSEKDVLTQFGYACKRLGVEIKTTSVSQAKGLIERDNETFQGRLVNELRINGITTIEAANEYLLTTFIPKFNSKFSMDFKKFGSVFEASPEDEKINYILAILTPRKFDNGNSIKFKNKYYQPYLNGKLKCFKSKTECLVINAFDGSLLVSVDDKVYELEELIKNKTVSENFDNIVELPVKEKKKYIPPMSHPWKLSSFKEQLKKAHTYNVYA